MVSGLRIREGAIFIMSAILGARFAKHIFNTMAKSPSIRAHLKRLSNNPASRYWTGLNGETDKTQNENF